MISAADLEFHTPSDAGHTWAETYFFPIIIPEERLMITVYVVARPGLGTMINDVTVYGSLSDTRADLVYFHAEPHLPGRSVSPTSAHRWGWRCRRCGRRAITASTTSATTTPRSTSTGSG